MTPNPITNSIILRGLELTVLLGWPKAERAETQVVRVDICISFPEPLKACHTDDLADSYCYDTLVQIIQEQTAGREFRLLEHLGYELFQIIKKTVAPTVKISVRTEKHPPVPGLTGGAVFYYGEENNSW